MPVTGLVLTIGWTPDAEQQLGQRLRAMQGVSAGTPQGTRWPVVVDSDDLPSHERLLRAVQQLPGVGACEIAFADFSDVQDLPAQPGPRRKERSHG